MVPIYRGVDISHWNANVNFESLKKQGIQFVIIKVGGHETAFYKDSRFTRNYNAAKNAGLFVGAYYFAGKSFTNAVRGKNDAQHFINMIKGKQFEFPVVLDSEITPMTEKVGATSAAVAFCKEMERNGYYVSIYGSDISVFKNRYNIEQLKDFDKWVARYGSPPNYVKEYGIWQYSNSGRFADNKSSFDLNYAYKEYPKIIKKNHLNGW